MWADLVLRPIRSVERLIHWYLEDVTMILKVQCSNSLFIIHDSCLGTGCEISLRRMQHSFINEQSALIQVMVWCRQATGQCWAKSIPPYGLTRSQWVNTGIIFHQPFVQKLYQPVINKCIIKSLHYWTLVSLIVGFPAQRANNEANIFMSWFRDIFTRYMTLFFIAHTIKLLAWASNHCFVLYFKCIYVEITVTS